MGFLEEIVREVRADVEAGTAYAPSLTPPPGPRRSMRRAIERDRDAGSLVVEYKRVSPGRAQTQLRKRSVAEFLDATRGAAPTAYSCLATRPRFDGAVEDVRDLAGRTDRPVLFKDFVVDERQVEAAARSGASAVLLIARLSSEGYPIVPLRKLADLAHRRGLEVLLEFHARTELSSGADVAADVYGVNSRDLDTLTIDRTVARETLREAVRQGLRPLLGLSGVEGSDDAQWFWRSGADGILVGSSVANADDPAAFLSRLRRTRREDNP